MSAFIPKVGRGSRNLLKNCPRFRYPTDDQLLICLLFQRHNSGLYSFNWSKGAYLDVDVHLVLYVLPEARWGGVGVVNCIDVYSIEQELKTISRNTPSIKSCNFCFPLVKTVFPSKDVNTAKSGSLSGLIIASKILHFCDF